MEAVLILLNQVVPSLLKLGVDVLPFITAGRNTINALQGGNHITDDQAAELRRLTESREAEWSEILRTARAEG